MPKPPGREISIISDWGSGIKLSADEDGLPEKIGFFLVGPTFSSWLNLKVRTHGNQQNLLTVCLWKTTSQFHRFFERSRIPMRGKTIGLSFMAFTKVFMGSFPGSLPRPSARSQCSKGHWLENAR